MTLHGPAASIIKALAYLVYLTLSPRATSLSIPANQLLLVHTANLLLPHPYPHPGKPTFSPPSFSFNSLLSTPDIAFLRVFLLIIK